MLIGLLTKASKPAAMMSLRSCGITDAVNAMTGIARVAGAARSCASASMPLMPGRWMSITTRSGARSPASATPSSPVSASIVR